MSETYQFMYEGEQIDEGTGVALALKNNKSALAKFGESSGQPTFNGEPIGIGDAPTDGKIYGRQNEEWSEVLTEKPFNWRGAFQLGNMYNAGDVVRGDDGKDYIGTIDGIVLPPPSIGWDEFFQVENGKSAYEIAVENGFEGTESEWLESIKGSIGETGIGISLVLEYFAVSDSNTVEPKTWLPVAPTMTPAMPYLWYYNEFYMTNSEKLYELGEIDKKLLELRDKEYINKLCETTAENEEEVAGDEFLVKPLGISLNLGMETNTEQGLLISRRIELLREIESI